MLHLTTQNFDICRMNHWQFSSDTPAKAGPEHPTLAVVMFYAVWCGKCAMMRPVIEDLEKKYQKKYFGSICFFEVETSESALLASLILSLESCFSVLAGWIILGERLSFRESLGCILMFLAIILAQLPDKNNG